MLPDGVYLNLPEEPYFAEKRLGSTDLSKLYLAREGWWWSSLYNPDRIERPTEAKEFGKALHKVVLEGDDAYAASVAIYPDKNELRKIHGENFCITVKEILSALEKRGFAPKATSGKDFLIEYCRTRAPELILWDVLDANWEKDNAGKIKVTAAEDRQIRVMAEAVRNHPDVGPLFQFGPSHIPLSEVTVLYHDQWGIPRRARLDQMLPQTTIDVKTLQNVSGRPLAFAAGEHLAKMGYHVQMADHHIARGYAYRFIREGKVFDGAKYDPQIAEWSAERKAAAKDKFEREMAWIKRFPTDAPNWDYAWLFYQKPDAKDGVAPIVLPWGEDYAQPDMHHIGDLHRRGLRCLLEAYQTYRTCMAQFGPDKPWTRVEPLHTSEESARKNRIFLPPYVGGGEAMPGEDEYL